MKRAKQPIDTLPQGQGAQCPMVEISGCEATNDAESVFFRTDDGYTLRLEAGMWTDGDLTFRRDQKNNLPVGEDGEAIAGTVLDANQRPIESGPTMICPDHNCGDDGEYQAHRTKCPTCGEKLVPFDAVMDGIITARANMPDAFGDDDDARIEWNTKRLDLMMFGQRLGDALYIVRCFEIKDSAEKLVFEYVYVDEEIAGGAADEWVLVGDDDCSATIRKIALDPAGFGISIESETSIRRPKA